MTTTLRLPWPPSVNHYWRHTQRGTFIATKGQQFRKDVETLVLMQRGAKPALTGRLRVHVQLFPPDRRERDIDNSMKALLDAVTHAGVWESDSQIDDLHIVRKNVEPDGDVWLTVEEAVSPCRPGGQLQSEVQGVVERLNQQIDNLKAGYETICEMLGWGNVPPLSSVELTIKTWKNELDGLEKKRDSLESENAALRCLLRDCPTYWFGREQSHNGHKETENWLSRVAAALETPPCP